MIAHLAVSCLLLSQSPLASGPITGTQFISRLDALESRLKTSQPGEASVLAASWSGDVRVQVGVDLYDVDLEWAGQPLRAAAADPGRWPRTRAAVIDGVHRVRGEAAAALSNRPVDRGEARAALDGVMRDRRFARMAAADWRLAAWQHVAEWVRRAWIASIGKRLSARTAGEVLAWVLAAGAMLVLSVWLVITSRQRRREAAFSIGRVEGRGAGGREFALQAVALVREGRIREAIRAAYRAAVQRLEEEGAWRADPTRTPREYLGLLPATHRRRAVLSRLTRGFERLWYGARPASPSDGDEILASLVELECLPRDHPI